MRALVLSDESLASVARLRQFAEQHPLNLYQIKKIIEGVSKPPGDDERFVCLVPVGFRCVFTIEEHRNSKQFRHLSVSVDGENWPNPAAVDQLMPLFGFHGGIYNTIANLEEHARAINVLEEITT